MRWLEPKNGEGVINEINMHSCFCLEKI